MIAEVHHSSQTEMRWSGDIFTILVGIPLHLFSSQRKSPAQPSSPSHGTPSSPSPCWADGRPTDCDYAAVLEMCGVWKWVYRSRCDVVLHAVFQGERHGPAEGGHWELPGTSTQSGQSKEPKEICRGLPKVCGSPCVFIIIIIIIIYYTSEGAALAVMLLPAL